MSDANVLKEQQLYNYSRSMAALQARKWETPKLRIANLSRDIVCLLTQGRTLALCKGATCGAMCSIADVSSQVYLEHLLISRDMVDVNDSSSLVLDLIKVCVCYGS
jgi:hypothetical protein